MLNYKIVRTPSRAFVEKPVEIISEPATKTTNINIFIGLHRIRSGEVSVEKLAKNRQKPLQFSRKTTDRSVRFNTDGTFRDACLLKHCVHA